MVLLLRALTALVGLLLLVVLTAAGLAAALFNIQAGDGTLSLSHLASLLALDELRDSVGGWLADLEAGGPAAAVAALCGAGAVLLGEGSQRAGGGALRALAEQPRCLLYTSPSPRD